MGLIDSIEQRLEKTVSGVFAAGSRGRIEPVDLASRIRREMDKKSYSISEGRVLAPNVFTIEFSEEDFPRAQDWGQSLAEELCDVAIRHARSQGYTLRGALRVTFVQEDYEDGEELRRGEFRVISAQERSGSRASRSPQQSEHAGARTASGTPPQDRASAALGAAASGASASGTPAAGSAASGSTAARSTASGRAAAAASGAEQSAPHAPAPSQASVPPRTSRPHSPVPPQGRENTLPQEAPLQPVLEIEGQRFSIQADSVVLGRSSQADITVEDTGVSRRHVEILHQDGVYLAVDLGSTNGSTVDGSRLEGRRQLVDGSVITMGRTRITFRLLAPRRSSQWHQS